MGVQWRNLSFNHSARAWISGWCHMIWQRFRDFYIFCVLSLPHHKFWPCISFHIKTYRVWTPRHCKDSNRKTDKKKSEKGADRGRAVSRLDSFFPSGGWRYGSIHMWRSRRREQGNEKYLKCVGKPLHRFCGLGVWRERKKLKLSGSHM